VIALVCQVTGREMLILSSWSTQSLSPKSQGHSLLSEEGNGVQRALLSWLPSRVSIYT
jgi:hypothetical protein